MLAKNYLVVDIERMRSDARASHVKMDTGLSFSKFIEHNGLTDSVFNNAKHNYDRPARENGRYNKAEIDADYVTDSSNIVGVGYIRKDTYYFLIKIFELDDIYLIPKRAKYKVVEDKEQKVTTVVRNDNTEILAKLDEVIVTLNRIGNLQMQILEKLPTRPIAKLPEKK